MQACTPQLCCSLLDEFMACRAHRPAPIEDKVRSVDEAVAVLVLDGGRAQQQLQCESVAVRAAVAAAAPQQERRVVHGDGAALLRRCPQHRQCLPLIPCPGIIEMLTFNVYRQLTLMLLTELLHRRSIRGRKELALMRTRFCWTGINSMSHVGPLVRNSTTSKREVKCMKHVTAYLLHSTVGPQMWLQTPCVYGL